MSILLTKKYIIIPKVLILKTIYASNSMFPIYTTSKNTIINITLTITLTLTTSIKNNISIIITAITTVDVAVANIIVTMLVIPP